MTLKNLILALTMLFGPLCIYGQDTLVWENVKVYEFQSTSYPDSLDICGGEWFIKASASDFNDLTEKEIKRIKKKVAKHGCFYVYIDIKRYWGGVPNGKIYILGLKRKEEK